jgi:aryl-alcohol dehydrogenase-like predicted oxidoreductase
MKPTVTSVIAGATTPAQVRANAKASSWVLTAAQLDEVDGIAPAP